jgi:hypothetical protein
MRQLINDPYAPQKLGEDPYGMGLDRLRTLFAERAPNSTIESDTTPLRAPKPAAVPLRVWYDCEFVEDGHTIDLLSIGMISEDGRRLYRINDNFGVMERAVERDWLRENVVKHLPVRVNNPLTGVGDDWTWDAGHPDYSAVRNRVSIRNDVAQFIRESAAVEGYEDVRLWAWYGAYDHVAYAQLFGMMIDLPPGFPMWTNDLRQEVDRLGNPELPTSNQSEHHALADAEELRYRHLWLEGRAV